MPEAQRWKELPPTQFHSPSFEQAEPSVVAPELPVAGVAGVAAGGAGASGVGVAAAALVTVARVVDASVATGGTSTEAETVAKIPPRLE